MFDISLFKGDVIAIWNGGVDDSIIKTSFKPFGQDWRAPEIVLSNPEIPDLLNVGLASCGFAIALWNETTEESSIVRASIHENLLLPSDALVAQCCQKLH